MTVNKFEQLIEDGSDILFEVDGEKLVIFTWLDEGIGVGKQYDDTPMETFKTPADLINAYQVNGKPLRELADKIIITEYS